MTDSVLMADLTWPEFEARVTDDPVIFLPCGASEQHGPHLPFSLDALLPTAIAEGVARVVDGLASRPLLTDINPCPSRAVGRDFPALSISTAQPW